MLTFILFIVLALGFGYFATQNVGQVTIMLAGYTFRPVPLYIVIGITLLIGLGFSWIVNLLNTLTSTLKLRDKDSVIKNANLSIDELNKKIKHLELENARLEGQLAKNH